MDSEKYIEMQEKIGAGKPVTDEGPYLHHVQWESYKGWGKGKLGGAIIGTMVGSLVGGAAAAVLLPTIGAAAAGIGVLAFAGVGMWKGMDEFGKIGTVSGAVAAGLDAAERRNRIYMDTKVNEIKAELGDKEAEAKLAEAREPAYRTTHYVPPQDPAMEHGPIFWKVAAIGLAIGAAAGLLLAASGLASGLLGHIVSESTLHAVSGVIGEKGIALLSMATFGAFGASFGINRDIFRKIFDQTDMMYRGTPRKLGEPAEAKMVTRAPEKEQAVEKTKEKIVYDGHLQYPESETHHRDQYLKAAKEHLLSMDHTKMMSH